MPIRFGGPGVTNTLADLTSNRLTLAAGSVWTPPANGYFISGLKYACVQQYDPISTTWLPISTPGSDYYGNFDGFNQRIANTSGCVVGAYISNAGSGYTSAPTVTASAGGATFQAIVGGAVNTTVSVANGGAGYTYAPIVVFSPPPAPGVQATGYATISGGVVTGITVTNQGAGYTYPPTVNLFNDPRDTTGANAQATASLTGAGTITGLLCTGYGSPQTSTPTLSFSGGGGSSAAATAIMNYAITGYTVTTAGAGYTAAAGNLWLSATPTPPAVQSSNRLLSTGIVQQRPAIIGAPASASGVITATGQFVIDGGSYEAVPAAGSVVINGGTGIITTAAVLALTVGGLADNEVYIFPN